MAKRPVQIKGIAEKLWVTVEAVLVSWFIAATCDPLHRRGLI
jgi:hypothetical protein